MNECMNEFKAYFSLPSAYGTQGWVGGVGGVCLSLSHCETECRPPDAQDQWVGGWVGRCWWGGGGGGLAVSQ